MIEEVEYIQRRNRLLEKLDTNSLALLLSATPKKRSNDTEYPYRQNSNFYYLTGFKEDSSALLLLKGRANHKVYLFVAKKDPALELWSGKRLGKEVAKELFCVDGVYEYEELERVFKENIVKKKSFYYDFSDNNTILEDYKKLSLHLYAHKNLAKELEMLRLIKSPAEIELIKKALKITKEAHHEAIMSASKLRYEYELQAKIEYIFKKNGVYSDAYTSIVASANAANTLHYIENNKELQRDGLILIDAGCEFDYYASDITRSIPASGVYSSAQKELYEMVLSVEKEIISLVKPGVMRSSLQSRSEELLCQGMIALGILKGECKTLLKKKAHKKYYPHGIGHWMGLDVHDAAAYRDKKQKEIPLMEGMVLTIEPGLYLDIDDETIPQKYRGIGIRIEDDILVTQDGFENLSANIVKEIDEIEAMAQGKK